MTNHQVTWSLMAVFLAFAAIGLFAQSIVSFSDGDWLRGLFHLAGAIGGVSFTCKAWGQR